MIHTQTCCAHKVHVAVGQHATKQVTVDIPVFNTLFERVVRVANTDIRQLLFRLLYPQILPASYP